MRCPYCGGEIEEGVLKCKHCGEWLDEAHRAKIRGWLILVAIGLVFIPIKLFIALFFLIKPALFGETWSILTTPGTPAYHQFNAPLLIIETCVNIVFTFFFIRLVVLFFQRRSIVPKMAVILFILNLCFAAADGIIVNSIPFVPARISQQDRDVKPEDFSRIPYMDSQDLEREIQKSTQKVRELTIELAQLEHRGIAGIAAASTPFDMLLREFELTESPSSMDFFSKLLGAVIGTAMAVTYFLASKRVKATFVL
jgi:hypothetical protein